MRLSGDEAVMKIFESKQKEVGREWRKVHYEEITISSFHKILQGDSVNDNELHTE